ncbi:MAG: lysylphosphatidylglycerol synthase domain-containing protein [Chloroflexota bacterium]
MPSLNRTLKLLIGLLVVGAFVFALYTQAGELSKHTFDVAPLYLAASGLLALLRGPFVVYPWWRIVRSWGYPLPWWRAVRLYFHSGLARYLPGQYWYVVGRAYLAEREGIPKSITAASTLVETVLVTGSAAGVALLGIATAPRWNASLRVLLISLGILLPVALLAATGSHVSTRFWDWLMHRLGRAHLPSRLTWGDASRALLGCYANWVLYGLIALFALAGVSGGDYLAHAPAVIGIFAASVLGAAVVLFVPQGLVIREGILVYLLNTLLAVPIPEAIATAALTRLIATAAEGLWALIALRV